MKERALGKLALAGALAFGGMAINTGSTSEVDAATVRSYSCSNTADRWVPLNKGEIVVVKASGIVIPADVSVDGVKQYDNLGQTATIIALKSSDNKVKKTWVINVDYPGSADILKCGATYTRTRDVLGIEASRLDARIGANDASKSVQMQWIKK